MRICSFSVRNYRSITRAYKVPFYDKSILIGPNNEGKSNILRGLVLTLQTLTRGLMPRLRRRPYDPYFYGDEDYGYLDYDWQRDFPIPLQQSHANRGSEFTIHFELTEEDKNDFYEAVKSRLVTNLVLTVGFFKEKVTHDVIISGRAKKALEKKYRFISAFLRDHINLQYIPAVRTAQYATDIVEGLLSLELSQLEDDPAYNELLTNISEAQEPVLASLARRLTRSVAEFVPDVKKIELNTKAVLRRAVRRSCRVSINDGVNTDLAQKGDGIKSLVAISLVKHSSKKTAKGRNLILAIEEPESHLHPAAIHRLGVVLDEISREQQVIITSHSPLLVDRLNIANNILVNKSRAKAASNIAEIRNILGVHISDNLVVASWVLLVEGTEDGKILKTWLRHMSPEVEAALQSGRIVIDDLQGGSNLSYKVAQYKALLCNVLAYLDHDKAGRDTFQKAKTKGLLSHDEVTFAICLGMDQSEIEDLVLPNVYVDAVYNHFGVELKGKLFRNNRKIWSDRVADVFHNQGKLWSKTVEMEVKVVVAELVEQNPDTSLNQKYAGSVKSLIKSIRKKVKI